MRFPNEISCFLTSMRFPFNLSYEISCFLAVTRFPNEMPWFVSLKRFHEFSL
jgi:hypothetical protein